MAHQVGYGKCVGQPVNFAPPFSRHLSDPLALSDGSAADMAGQRGDGLISNGHP